MSEDIRKIIEKKESEVSELNSEIRRLKERLSVNHTSGCVHDDSGIKCFSIRDNHSTNSFEIHRGSAVGCYIVSRQREILFLEPSELTKIKKFFEED